MPLPKLDQLPPRTRNIVLACCIIVLLMAVAAIVWPRNTIGGSAKAPTFYSFDDGKTYHEGPLPDLPPFTRDGQEGLEAVVYLDASGTPFVAYLRKYTDDARQAIGAGDPRAGDEERVAKRIAHGTLVKPPGGQDWLPSSDPIRAARLLNPKDPATGEPLQMYRGKK